MTSNSLVEVSQRFEGTYHIHLHGRKITRGECLSFSAYFSSPKLQAVHFSETSVLFQQTVWRHIPEENTLRSHRYELLLKVEMRREKSRGTYHSIDVIREFYCVEVLWILKPNIFYVKFNNSVPAWQKTHRVSLWKLITEVVGHSSQDHVNRRILPLDNM
jgi:hypothetical protein